jgi:hypothetical protein
MSEFTPPTDEERVRRGAVFRQFLTSREGELAVQATRSQLVLRAVQPGLDPAVVVERYHEVQAFERLLQLFHSFDADGQMAARPAGGTQPER